MGGGRVLRARLQRMDFHRHVVLTLSLQRRQHHFGIVGDAQRLGVDALPVDDQRNGVDAAEHERPDGRRPRAEKSTPARAGHVGYGAAGTKRTRRLGIRRLSSCAGLSLGSDPWV